MSVPPAAERFATDPCPPRPDQVRIAALEDELTTLSGHINAAIARFLIVLEEVDRLEGYKDHGLVSSAHWLHWRCCFGRNAAREKVRVARALPALPQIRALFETGTLSYSKVRAMTRIATPENEPALLQVARHGTTHHVEKLVSKWRGAERAREIRRAGTRHAVRSLHWHYDDEGCLVIRANLPPEQGARVIEALQVAMDRLQGADSAEIGDETDARSADAGGSEQAAGVVRDVAAETAHGKCTGTPQGPVDVSAETSDARIEERPSLSQRRADALVFLVESWLAGDPSGRRTGDGYLVNVYIDAASLASAAAGRSELADGAGLDTETVRRLCCDGGLVTHLEDADGKTLDVGRRTRAIPPAIRRALRHRDPCCRFPGYTRTRWLDGHHVVHWADSGETALDNLVHLCRHHHRLVHEGGFGVRVDACSRFVFTTPAGAVIPEPPRSHGLDQPLEKALETFQLRRGLTIDARTADCRRTGEHMDYDSAAWLLMQAAA